MTLRVKAASLGLRPKPRGIGRRTGALRIIMPSLRRTRIPKKKLPAMTGSFRFSALFSLTFPCSYLACCSLMALPMRSQAMVILSAGVPEKLRRM